MERRHISPAACAERECEPECPDDYALCGCTVNIPTLDKRVIALPCNDIIRPGTVKRLRGEGLPFPKNPSQRGDLIVEFAIRFPDRIPPQSREIIRQHLPQS